MNLNDLAKSNNELLDFIRSDYPGRLNMYIGTLDTAIARFNTVLLKLSQDRLLEEQHFIEICFCDDAIKAFYKNTIRLRDWPVFTRPFIKLILHGIGTRRIPHIKKLHDTLITNDGKY